MENQLARQSDRLLFIVALWLGSCSYHLDKGTEAISSEISFASVKQAVLKPRCIVCHDGSPGKWDCAAYDTIKERVEKIKQRVLVRKDMPPGTPLSSSQIELLSRWIEAGAPEHGTAPITPETPLEPKFDSIREKIFVPMCSKCHIAGGTSQQVPLLILEDLLNSPRELIKPFNPDESQLIIALKKKTTKPKNMPPPDSGIRKLTREEIGVISEWIAQGAKD